MQAGQTLLVEAECLEREASARRIAYFRPRIGNVNRLLDVGCGNGYGVEVWRKQGTRAIGVDRSLYRLARWISEHRLARPFVVADAAALPFAAGAFDAVISSGMIKHVGVSETSNPYTIQPHTDRDERRADVIAELARVTCVGGRTIIDCPNGAFPVDFWHGDQVGAFRRHAIPDTLLPSFRDFVQWAARAGCEAKMETVTGRLAFRQVGRHWWGRTLAAPVAATLRALDLLVKLGFVALPARTYPYLVVVLNHGASHSSPARLAH